MTNKNDCGTQDYLSFVLGEAEIICHLSLVICH
jgi:hypothetical protein